MKRKLKIISLLLLIIISITNTSIAAWGNGGGLQKELPVYFPPTDTMTLPDTYPQDASNAIPEIESFFSIVKLFSPIILM